MRIRAATASICSPTVLSISGLTCAGTLTRAPATESAVSPRLTCAARFGSKCQAAASFGREVMVTAPLISACALSCLMLMLPICLPALSPSRLPSAFPTAPVAFEVNDPVYIQNPGQRRRQRQHVLGAGRSDRAARRGPADIGVLQHLRYRVVGLAGEIARRGAVGGVANRAQRNRNRRKDDGRARRRRQRRQLDKLGRATGARGDSQSSIFRLTPNDTTTTALASRIVLRRDGRRIVPPD